MAAEQASISRKPTETQICIAGLVPHLQIRSLLLLGLQLVPHLLLALLQRAKLRPQRRQAIPAVCLTT